MAQPQFVALGAVHGQNSVVAAIGRLLDAQAVAARKEFAYVPLDNLRILGRLAQQLQQIIVAQEIEARE